MITLRNVNKGYDGVPVLRDCSLEVEKGKIYALAGRNGAGKTTLLKLTAGFLCPDSGKILLGGEAVWENREKQQRKIGSMIEAPVFYEHLSARENLKLHQVYMRTCVDVEAALNLVGLDGISEKPVSSFSMGMRQRLAIARALIHGPEVLLLDEPLNGLDPVGVEELKSVFTGLARSGTTILISSHILGDIESIADKTGILAGGKITGEFDMRGFGEEDRRRFEAEALAAMKGDNE